MLALTFLSADRVCWLYWGILKWRELHYVIILKWFKDMLDVLWRPTDMNFNTVNDWWQYNWSFHLSLRYYIAALVPEQAPDTLLNSFCRLQVQSRPYFYINSGSLWFSWWDQTCQNLGQTGNNNPTGYWAGCLMISCNNTSHPDRAHSLTSNSLSLAP